MRICMFVKLSFLHRHHLKLRVYRLDVFVNIIVIIILLMSGFPHFVCVYLYQNCSIISMLLLLLMVVFKRPEKKQQQQQTAQHSRSYLFRSLYKYIPYVSANSSDSK